MPTSLVGYGGKSMIPTEVDRVGVDWGTSNLRAWGIGTCGAVSFSHMSDQGMNKLTPDAYPGVLGALLSANLPSTAAQIDVLICGMAGAKQGWMEAPYLDAPADLETIVDRAVIPSMPDAGGLARILTGA